MVDICPICGLPKDICVCGEIHKEQQKIKIRLETRKFRKAMTLIEGLNSKDIDLGRLAQKMKSYCACGGTAKNGQIMLQGDQREKVYQLLIQMGYPKENIEVQ
ncbi:MAG: translation initiation factor [Candidatus Bathyarchaeia archaeon]